MSDKKLMNEVLPAPKTVTSGAARERVVNHMKTLVQVGAATVTLAGCPPFAVVDPLPPPARCKTMNDVLSELTATVTSADGGSVIILVIDATTDFQSGVELDMAGGTIGGSITSLERAQDSGVVVVAVTQCHEGGVELDVYEAGSRLRGVGVLSGGGMTREAAFGKLQALIGAGLPVDEVRRLVELDLCGELS